MSESAGFGNDRQEWPLVSVVLLNWNSGHLGALAAKSVVTQSWSPIEFIVVDNASTDDSLAQIADIAPDALVIRHDDNLGFATGMNAGIAKATGAFVLPLNCDAELDETYIERLLEVLDRFANAAAAGGRVRSERAGSTGPLAVTWLMRTRNLELSDSITCDKVNGACPLFRACALDDVIDRFGGPYDETYGTYGEDVDLSATLRRLGWIYRYEPAASAKHVRSYSSAMKLADKRGPLRVSTIANRHRNITRHGSGFRLLAGSTARIQDIAFCARQLAHGDREVVPDVRAAWRRVAHYRTADRARRVALAAVSMPDSDEAPKRKAGRLSE